MDIKSIRIAHNLSQEKFSKHLGISERKLRAYENNIEQCPNNVIDMINNFLQKQSVQLNEQSTIIKKENVTKTDTIKPEDKKLEQESEDKKLKDFVDNLNIIDASVLLRDSLLERKQDIASLAHAYLLKQLEKCAEELKCCFIYDDKDFFLNYAKNYTNTSANKEVFYNEVKSFLDKSIITIDSSSNILMATSPYLLSILRDTVNSPIKSLQLEDKKIGFGIATPYATMLENNLKDRFDKNIDTAIKKICSLIYKRITTEYESSIKIPILQIWAGWTKLTKTSQAYIEYNLLSKLILRQFICEFEQKYDRYNEVTEGYLYIKWA